jgi:hypothetical protein
MYDYAVLDSGYNEASCYVGGFEIRRYLRTYCKLKRVLMATNTFELYYRLRV